MNKINGSANMKVSAKNPATAHTRDRYVGLIKKVSLTTLEMFANL